MKYMRLVASAGLRMARHLRMRRLAQIMAGGYGTALTVATWGGFGLVAVIAFLLGWFFVILALAVLVAAIVAMVTTGVPSRWSHWGLIASCIATVAAFIYVWWVAGAAFDANEAGLPVPVAARFGGLGLVVVCVGVISIVSMAIVSAVRARRSVSEVGHERGISSDDMGLATSSERASTE